MDYFEILAMPFVTQEQKARYWEESKAFIRAQQAKIDELMLECCPNEMTPERLEEWKKHQVVYRGY